MSKTDVDYFGEACKLPVQSWVKLTDNIIRSRYIHPMYYSWLKTRKFYRNIDAEHGTKYSSLLGPLIGKWHYIYRSKKGKISLIEMTDEFHTDYPWETCGALEEDGPMRFATREDAEARIKELLD